ncbi:hypothetical protein LOC70_13175, partial [Rhodopirellula sp. JC737]|nr:hypothetical protein [Rhodopirellula sp. JC737]
METCLTFQSHLSPPPGDGCRSPTEMEHALNYSELLKANDDPERSECPLGFDYASEKHRFQQFTVAFAAALTITPKIET